MAVSTALGLSAMSSSASAGNYPVTPERYCEGLAYQICYPPGQPWAPGHIQCWNETYAACMEDGLGLSMNAASAGDRRESRPAVRPAARLA